ncbi:MAG: S-layer homology domain-containing protein, partial [Oscillospiraceae bacterium]|nr:S-layer homology domain-containing protein [Oscillospiraceae bacterium]
LAGFNKVRKSEGGIFMFSSDFGSTTMNTSSGVDVVLSLPSGSGTPELSIGGSITATVDKVLESAGSLALSPGKIVLSVNSAGSAYDLNLLRSLKAGDAVTISCSSADTRWNNTQFATGGLYRLLAGGKVQSGLDTASSPRTAVGVRADGSMVFYTIDGRSPGYSIGATMVQVANRLLELGCTDAICLDGGGSTSLGVTMPDEDSFSMINKPSDGSPRANSTHIVLVSQAKATGVLGHFYVTPYDAMLLCGAALPINAAPLDTNYYTMAYEGKKSYAVYNGDGIISDGGIFVAGSSAGTSTVRVSSGGAEGSATITVVKTPDSIRLIGSGGNQVKSLALSPGGVADLTASASIHGLPLVTQNNCFTWTVSGGVGTVDANGRFTAGSQGGAGTLTVSAGGSSTSIPITVSGHITTIDDLENGADSFSSSETANISVEQDLSYVKYGWQSLRADYSLESGSTASIGAFLPVTNGDAHFSLFVYGDSSGNTLMVASKDSAGKETASYLCTLNFSGWRRAAVVLPAGTSSITGFQIVKQDAGAAKGTIRLDQLLAANEAVEDSTPPVISGSISGRSLSAAISDTYDKTVSKDSVYLTYDGSPIAFSYTASTGKLTASLPVSDGKLHRVTLIARDKSGNLQRYSANVEPSVEIKPSFADVSGSWAKKYAQYLYDESIAAGIQTPSGLAFQPDRNMTRSEFAVMLSRFMGIATEDYQNVSLPFADRAQIPAWAEDAVKAMYSIGILKGASNNGILTFSPSGNISRAEAMTIIGRTLEQGYAQTGLTYSDAGAVPAWALPSMRTLATLQVISGYNNKIYPLASISRAEVAKLLVSIL